MNIKPDYLKDILKFSSIPPSRMEKELFLGVVACFILDKNMTKKNSDLKIFVEKIFNYNFKNYLYKSRTILLASIISRLYKLDSDELQKMKVSFFVHFDELSGTKKEGSLSKWLKN